jgi:hypothetical protein
MSKAVAKPDRSSREGHGEDGPVPNVKKGTFIQVGTAAPLEHSPISVNRKTGKEQTDQW